MKKICLSLFCIFLLCGCMQNGTIDTSKNTNIEMEVTENYSISDPFVNAKLFYVTKDMDTLHLTINFVMDGNTGILEIEEKSSGEVLWSETWDESIENTVVPVTLYNIEKEKEYVIRFTGTKIKYAKVIMTSEQDVIKERARSLHTKKES